MTTPHEHQTIRIWTRTLPLLRLVAALSGERMVAVVDRLVRQELARLEQQQEANHASPPFPS